MLNFLFWNAGRRKLKTAISRLAKLHAIDVLILAEHQEKPAAILLELNKETSEYSLTSSLCKRITIFTRFNQTFSRPMRESGNFTIRRVSLPVGPEFLLASAHLPSKLFHSEDSQVFFATELAQSIQDAEQAAGHSRTVFVGDLNMNPFEKGMVAAAGLHAVMTRELARRGTRTVGGKSYPLFYNPMWSFLGDLSSGPPGTYFRRETQHVSYFWHTFDQLLIRPELIDRFPVERIRILDKIETDSLLRDDGTPDSTRGSDHLPMIFSIAIS